MDMFHNRSDFDVWLRRIADGKLFAASSADQQAPSPIPLYENGHTLLEGGHAVRIFVEKHVLAVDFQPMHVKPCIINGVAVSSLTPIA